MTDQWAKRSQITPASFNLMVQHCIASTGRGGKLKKPDKTTFETRAGMAALILSVAQELRAGTPLASTHVDPLVAAFVSGDPGLEVELQCAHGRDVPHLGP